MNPAIQHFPRSAHQPQECQECVELRAEVEALTGRVEELTRRLATAGGNYLRLRAKFFTSIQREAHHYDMRTPSHDRETWRQLSSGRPAGRSGDVK